MQREYQIPVKAQAQALGLVLIPALDGNNLFIILDS